jgi:hypothetical protein
MSEPIIAELVRGPQCTNKKSFPCRMAAESALAQARAFRIRRTGADFYAQGRVYICECCSGWHITSKKLLEKT